MTKKMMTRTALALAVALCAAPAAVGDMWTGVLYGPNSSGDPVGLDGTGQWVGEGTSLTWNITRTDDVTHYCYTLDYVMGSLSHFILEVSENFTYDDISNVTVDGVPWTTYEIDTFSSSNPSNPEMPNPLYAIKFDDLSEGTHTICFDSARLPMEGSAYGKDGKAGNGGNGVSNAVWNSGLADPENGAMLLVPDTTPEPGALLLVTLGGIGLLRRRRRA